MEKKSRLKLLEATEDASMVTEEEIEETEEWIEASEGAEMEAEMEAETMDSEAETIEDPEEISVTDQRDVSTVARMDILPETVNNLNYYFKFSDKTKTIQLRNKRPN